MIEKIAPIIVAAAMFFTGLNYSGPADPSEAPASTNMITSDLSYDDADAVADPMPLLLEALGEDLIARGKDSGFSLSSDFTCYSTPGGGAFMFIAIELRSAIGTAMYDSNTVDWELMRDIEYAVVDSNIFGLSEEDMATVKQYYYTPDNRSEDVDLPCGLNIHINETPFGYEAILYLRHNSIDVPDNYEYLWNTSYEWDELIYDSRSITP